MEKTVLTFDICSSTSILEDLHRTNTVDRFELIFKDIMKFLEKNKDRYSYEIYKFLGDGFILIFDSNINVDSILEFTISLNNDCNIAINKFISKYIETEQSIPRIGITCGVDKGKLENFTISNKNEYIGRPINVACRLQSSLNKEEHTNKVLISKKIYNEINTEQYKMICSRTTRVFKNIANNAQVSCYEFNPLYLINKEKYNLRKSIATKLEDEDFNELLSQFMDDAKDNIISSTIFKNVIMKSSHFNNNDLKE